jgi:hypothetical protein
MPANFDDVEFFAKKHGGRWPASMDEMVDGWIALQHAEDRSPEEKALLCAARGFSELKQ